LVGLCDRGHTRACARPTERAIERLTDEITAVLVAMDDNVVECGLMHGRRTVAGGVRRAVRGLADALRRRELDPR